MNDENISKLKKNICAIYSKKTAEPIRIDSIDIIKEIHKYSNTGIPIFKIYLNSKIMSRNNPYRIEYKCLTCNRTNIINLELFQRKLNKNILGCNYCREHNEIKKAIQSNYMRKRTNKQ